MTEKHYTDLVDEAVGLNMYTHRTLRTCFDPASSEWNETKLKEKIDILKKVVAKGNDLQELILDYKSFYIEMNKVHVARHVEDGLTELVQYLLEKKEDEDLSI